jgi:hypothetical protein
MALVAVIAFGLAMNLRWSLFRRRAAFHAQEGQFWLEKVTAANQDAEFYASTCALDETEHRARSRRSRAKVPVYKAKADQHFRMSKHYERRW